VDFQEFYRSRTAEQELEETLERQIDLVIAPYASESHRSNSSNDSLRKPRTRNSRNQKQAELLNKDNSINPEIVSIVNIKTEDDFFEELEAFGETSEYNEHIDPDFTPEVETIKDDSASGDNSF